MEIESDNEYEDPEDGRGIGVEDDLDIDSSGNSEHLAFGGNFRDHAYIGNLPL